MKTIFIFFLLLNIPLPARGQDTIVRGTITYLTNDAIYTSLGRNHGVADSTLLFVFSGQDTVARLRVFATSSSSSACYLVNSVKTLSIGDSIVAIVPPIPVIVRVPRDTLPVTISSTTEPSLNNTIVSREIPEKKFIRGRIGAQYFTNHQDVTGVSLTQPGIVINLKGETSALPLQFELYGNFRSSIIGSQSPFASNSQSRTRLYRLSAQYNDTLTVVSIGRIIPAIASSIGYIDGAFFARHIGNWTLGIAGGYEPSFSENGFTTDFKKFAFFSNYQSDGALRAGVTLAYAKRFFHSEIDREAISININSTLSQDIYVYVLSEIDLRRKSNNEFIIQPGVTNVYSTLNYHINSLLTAGIGYNAWRPSYSFSAIKTIPDSMIDASLRSSLTANVSLHFPYGISLYDSYTPRSSKEGFAKEYANFTSLGLSNIFNEGISVRATMNLNSTAFSAIQNYGINLGRNFYSILDANIRYQTYRYDIKQFSEISSSHSLAIDLTLLLSRHLSAWTSFEQLYGSNTEGYNFYLDIGWEL